MMITDEKKQDIIDKIMEEHKEDPNAYFAKGIYLGIEAAIKAFDLADVSSQRELLLKDIGAWLVLNTDVDVEKIVDLQENFKQ